MQPIILIFRKHTSIIFLHFFGILTASVPSTIQPIWHKCQSLLMVYGERNVLPLSSKSLLKPYKIHSLSSLVKGMPVLLLIDFGLFTTNFLVF